MCIEEIIDVELLKILLIICDFFAACFIIKVIAFIFLTFETKFLIQGIFVMIATTIFLMILP